MHPLRSSPALLALAILALAGTRPSFVLGQTLTVPEYRELVLANEGKLAGLDREIAVENARLDRLVAERDAGGSPGGQERAGQLSAQIVKVSNRLAELERRKRVAQADLSALRAALHERYTGAIDGNLERLGFLQESDPAYADLYVETSRYIDARDSLELQIRMGETLRNFRDFPILLTDGPSEIREKAGFYRDYVRDVDVRLAAINREIEQVRDRERVSQRMREFREDLEFQGADAPERPGDAGGGDLRENPAGDAASEDLELLARVQRHSLSELEREKSELELLRRGFEARVRAYEERARTIYGRQSPQPRGRP